MEFNLKFSMDNAAFSDYPEGEISSILRKVIKQVDDGNEDGRIGDTNGNKVGKWEVTE